MTEIERLKQVVEQLQSEDGCPWDKAQTHTSLKPTVIEEAAEVICGINILDEKGDADNLKEELGDLHLKSLEKKEDELNKKMDAGIDMDQQRTTLNELADRYLENKSKSVQETTFQTMTVYNDRYVRNGLGKKRLADLKRSTVKEFYLGLISGRNPLSIAIVARLNSILWSLWNV